MYTKQELDRLIALFHAIEGNKAHEYAAPSYKDSASLEEMAQIVARHKEETEEALPETITVLWYLSKCYDEMCRAGRSVGFYQKLLAAHRALSALRAYDEEEKKEFEEAFYHAVRARNYYCLDDCADFHAIVKDSVIEDKREALFASAKQSREGLPKYDPVEMSEEYLAVIDAVEEKIEKTITLDLCHEYWRLKAKYLAEYGILWRSPALLNPGVMFD